MNRGKRSKKQSRAEQAGEKKKTRDEIITLDWLGWLETVWREENFLNWMDWMDYFVAGWLARLDCSFLAIEQKHGTVQVQTLRKASRPCLRFFVPRKRRWLRQPTWLDAVEHWFRCDNGEL